MQLLIPARKHLRARIFERIGANAIPTSPGEALCIFLDLSLEYEALREFKSLCVLVPEVCLQTPASLYLRNRHGALQLRRTTNLHGPKIIHFPEPICPAQARVIAQGDLYAFPICDTSSPDPLQGVFCVHAALTPREQDFYAQFVERVARVMSLKQIVVSNRQRLTFINNLVRDIGHNVIVPNMYFKLLFLRMEKALAGLGRNVDALTPVRPDAPDAAIRRELPGQVRDLREQLSVITKRFQQASLFLESLLRRGHFEKGRYDLVLRECKFKSQILEPQLERFRALLQEQGVRIEIAPDVRIDQDITLQADLGLLSQVVANLLSNAVKYTQPVQTADGRGAKRLVYGWEIETNAFGTGKPGIQVYIATTGKPLPSADAARLFEADFRSEASGPAEGTGHGLFFVQQIVELHGGRVKYEHAREMNIFFIILPQPDPTPSPAEALACLNPS